MNEQNKNTTSDVLNDANNPMNVNDTYQTTNKDGTIKEEYRVEGLLDDASNTPINRYSNTPNTKTDAVDSKTGSGLKAAEGTNYSWNTKADERAGLDYKSAVLESKSNMLENRQNIESQGQQAQDQFAMKQYTQNQSIDKVGWTGGYVLDSERQVNYLKQTIQAQMYGQMELQKYGYDTSLAAARLAYDTNRYDLALEYYNTALSRAVSEAEITGYYVSPETNEMLDQYSIASQTLNDPNAKEEDKLRADKILTSVYDWFEGHGISKQGVETYNHIVQERTHKMSVEQTLDYINKANKQIDSNTFTKLDENGNPSMSKDGTTMETINFNTVSKEDLLDYIGSSEMAKQQYYGYLDTKITGETETQFKTWLISKGLMDKQEDGTYTPKSNTDYSKQLYNFLQTSDIYNSMVEQISNLNDPDQATKLYDTLMNWDFEIALPDGSSMVKTLNELQSELSKSIKPSDDGTLQDLINRDDGGNPTHNFESTTKTGIFVGNEHTSGNIVKLNDELGDAFFWDVKAINGGDWDKESDFVLDNNIGDKYNLEIATYYKDNELSSEMTNILKTAYKATHNNTNMENGQIVLYNDTMYVWVQDTHGYSGFKKIKGQCGKGGGESLKSDIKGGIGW